MHCWLTMVTLASVMRHCIPWIPHANHKWFIKPGRSNEPICPNVNRIFVRHLKGINSFVVEVKSWTRRQIKKKKTLQEHAFGGFEGIRNARPSSKGAHTDTGGFHSRGSTASASIIHALLSRFNPAQTAHLTRYTLIHSNAYFNTPSDTEPVCRLNTLTWIPFPTRCDSFIKCINVWKWQWK